MPLTKQPDSFSLLAKICYGLILACVTFAYLSVYPYFPAHAVTAFALAVIVISLLSPAAAMSLSAFLFAVALAYHAFALATIYVIVFLFVALYAWSQRIFAEAFLVIAAAPLLASVNLLGVPLEFLVVIIAPLFLTKGRAFSIVLCAYLWCLFYGMVNHQEFIGNIPVGKVDYAFYSLRPMDLGFYDFSWIGDKINNFPVKNFNLSIVNIITHIAGQTGQFIQAGAWAAGAWLMAWFMERNKMLTHLFGIIVAATGVVIGQHMAAVFYSGKIDIDPPVFLMIVVACSLAIFFVFELINIVNGKYKVLPLGVGEKKMDMSSVNRFRPTIHVQAALATPKNPAKLDDFLKDRPSLEETLKVQRQINDYMKKRFVHDATALAIDIVGSTALKDGESEDGIIVSFTEYWRFVDGAVWRREGRLLNRAGDGAIYVFKYADQAITTAKDILIALAKFNKKGNLLKKPFQIRMGMDTGRIVEESSGSGSDVFSRVIDIAAHLEEQAQVNGILISKNTYDKLSKMKGEFIHKGRFDRDNIDIYSLKI